MAYVLEAYYTSTYFGVSAGSDFSRFAARASDDITSACPMAAKDATEEALDLTVLTVKQLALLKKATCAQIEWYVANGDEYNESQAVGGERIGNFSRQSNLTQRKGPAALSPRAMAFLEQSGLMFRGAEVFGQLSCEDCCDE